MILKLVTLTFVSCVVCDSCVKYDFEEGFNDLFSDYGVCNTLPLWIVGEYSTLGLTSPFEQSTTFITPLTTMSCASSHLFTLNAGGRIEFNIYMERTHNNDLIQILVNQELPDGSSFVTGMGIANNVNGWDILKINIVGPNSYQGYVSNMSYNKKIKSLGPPNVTYLFIYKGKNVVHQVV